jgi:hypothetical protein
VVPAPTIPRAALATALLATILELALLFVALSPRPFNASRHDRPTLSERVTFVVPALSAVPTPERRAAPPPASASSDEAPVETPASQPPMAVSVAHDSTPVAVASPRASDARAAGEPPTGTGSSAIGPVLTPRGFNPSSPLARHVIDSVLDSLNANMPALIWARVPTSAERDAAYKEGALAMRLAGRTLLVPADPHLAPGVRLPAIFSRQRQRAVARARTDSILAENMARLTRLRARAQRDSLRRDSLQHADSARRVDSLRAAIPRRRLDARTRA